MFGDEYISLSSSLCSLLHSRVASSLLGPNILLSTLFLNTLSLCSSLSVKDQVSHPHKTRVLPERLIVSQLIKKFPAFYGTQRFINAFARARSFILSWTRSFQPATSHQVSLRSILVVSSHLRLDIATGLLRLRFHTKVLYAPFLSPIHATYPVW
jgi:hypothetical protein